jgi:haloalkane dehalogenase
VHGQPTWSYLWRNVIPHLEGSGRVIAVDLIGFGKSDQPDIRSTLEDHARYLDAFIRALELDNLILVVHDWGSVLGQDYAARFPDNVAGIAMMEAGMSADPEVEAVLLPFEDDVMDDNRAVIRQILQPDIGERLIYEDNAFIEQIMPRAVVEPLSDDEMNAYREPFESGRSRLPMLMFPRELFDPATGGPPPYAASAARRRTSYLQSSETPMLLLTFAPGGLVRAPQIAWAKQHIQNLTVRHIGPGRHYVQEDHPDAIGEVIAEWIRVAITR